MVLLKSDVKMLERGASAPKFSLKNIDENEVSLDDFKGKIVVVIFMCNHCPYVKPKFEEIGAIQKDYSNKGVVVIGINSNDPNYDPEDGFEVMKEIAGRYGYRYYLVDETQEIARAYGAVCTPDTFVFDKNHKLAYHGRINNAMEPNDTVTKKDMREVLDDLVAGEEIVDWFVPSMGCSIKWKFKE